MNDVTKQALSKVPAVTLGFWVIKILATTLGETGGDTVTMTIFHADTLKNWGYLIGVAIFAAGVRNFSHAATPVPSSQPVRALATAGVHGWSRNPIYVGMFLLYAGIGIAARSPWVLILALPLAITMRYVVVAREEAYLERRFGDAYRDYKARVRRWL